MASFSVKNRAAMFEKRNPIIEEAEEETSENKSTIRNPASPSPSEHSRTSYTSSYSQRRSMTRSPLSSGPYKSFTNSPKSNSGDGPRTPKKSGTPKRSGTPKKNGTPKRSETPNRKTTHPNKILSPFFNTVETKPVVLPNKSYIKKSNPKSTGWATDSLRSSSLVSNSPFKNNPETRGIAKFETRDSTLPRRFKSAGYREESEFDCESTSLISGMTNGSGISKISGLKSSLSAAKVVLEEERSNPGSSNASSRSSLSSKELSDIAKRALNIARKKSTSPKPQNQKNEEAEVLRLPAFSKAVAPEPTVVPMLTTTAGTAPKVLPAVHTRTNSSPSAFPSSPAKPSPNPKMETTPLPSLQTSRVKNRAAAVAAARRNRAKVNHNGEARLALLTSAKKTKDKKEEQAEKMQSTSFESPSLDDMEISQRLGMKASMKASRVLAMKNSFNKSEPRDDISQVDSVASFGSSRSSRRIDHPAFVARASPGTKRATEKQKDGDKPFSAELISSFRHFSEARTDGPSNEIPPSGKTTFKASAHTKGEISMDGSFLEQDNSLHSMSGRNTFGHTPTQQEVSLSNSNTLSMMSSMHDNGTFTPSNRTSRKFGGMSPGPSMRSAHSMANSMISMTPSGHKARNNPDLDYILNTASESKQSGVDPDVGKNHKTNSQDDSPSNSPPGFKIDGEEKKIPVGDKKDTLDEFFSGDFFENCEVASAKDVASYKNDFAQNDDGGTNDVVTDDDVDWILGQIEDSTSGRDVSMSSKGTVSTSIRTGLSSIQSELPEGSKSMRSGLSGIFPEKSKSMRQTKIDENNLPGTIHEEEHETKAQSHSTASVTSEEEKTQQDTLFDGLGNRSEGSEGEDKMNTEEVALLDNPMKEESAKSDCKDVDTHTEVSDTLFEGVSTVSSKKSWWKGKKMKSKLKNAFAKKSAVDANVPASPKALPYRVTKRDEDEDIFGGLEDAETSRTEEKVKSRNTKIISGKMSQSKRQARQIDVVTPVAEMKQTTSPKTKTPSIKNEKSSNDRFVTNVEYEENNDVNSEITTSILGDVAKRGLNTPFEQSLHESSKHMRAVEESKSTSPRTIQEEESRAKVQSPKSKSRNDSETNHARCEYGPSSLWCGLGAMFAGDAGLCFGSSQPAATPREEKDMANKCDGEVLKEFENKDKEENNKSPYDKKREMAHGMLKNIANSALQKDDMTTAESQRTEGNTSSERAEGNTPVFDGNTTEAPTVDTRDSKEGTKHSRYSALSSATPMTLTNNQRSLVEKFTKHLANDGVEVLKLNTKKQWQVRYFTISKEQVALTAHEALRPSGDVAQCPKALLWLKKFSGKASYGISNIDKQGHGGMMLANLINMKVNESKGDHQLLSFPKKLQENFKKSVTVTLDYSFEGATKSVEFLCRDNDEAQFLCTCMRVTRDLLKREEILRQRLEEI